MTENIKMIYLRTKEQISKFCEEHTIEPISVAAISEAIENKLDFTAIGFYQSIYDQGFFTFRHRGGHKTQDSKFAATGEVLDFLVNSKILSDTVGEKYPVDFKEKIVKLFAKMKEGKVYELFALNTGNYFETHGSGKQQGQTEDLWW